MKINRQSEFEKNKELEANKKRLEEYYYYGTPFVYKNLDEALAAIERVNYLRELLKDKVEEPNLSYRDMRLQKEKWNRHFLWKNISQYKSMGYPSTYILKYIKNIPINYN
jgi:hypothetical protein